MVCRTMAMCMRPLVQEPHEARKVAQLQARVGRLLSCHPSTAHGMSSFFMESIDMARHMQIGGRDAPLPPLTRQHIMKDHAAQYNGLPAAVRWQYEQEAQRRACEKMSGMADGIIHIEIQIDLVRQKGSCRGIDSNSLHFGGCWF